MPITRAVLQGPSRGLLRLPLARPPCGMLARRQLHATAQRRNSTGTAQYAADLPAKKVYQDSFPCTLHYYSWRGPTMAMHGSDLSSGSDAAEEDNLLGQDVVRVQEDGLVYPGPKGNDSVWNGALMMPHATFLLELTDNYLDNYVARKSVGRDVPEPYFFTVPKGGYLNLVLLQAGGLIPRLIASQASAYPPRFS